MDFLIGLVTLLAIIFIGLKYRGKSILMFLINHGFYRGAWQGRINNFAIGAYGRQDGNYTILMTAASINNTRAARALIDMGIDVNAVDKDGNTALGHSFVQENIDVAKVLIEAGANVNHVNKLNFSGLMSAITLKHTGTVKLLIDAGADVNFNLVGGGLTALMITVMNSNSKLAKILIEAGADYIAILAKAASEGDVNTVTLLINAGADINTADNNNLNALSYATAVGQTEMVKLLIDAGADVNIAVEKNVTALTAAVSGGHTEIVKLLVKAGADISNTTLFTTDREKLKKAQEGEVGFSLVKDEIKDEIRMLIYSEGEYIDVESVKIVDGNQEGFYDATLNTTDGVNKLMKNVEKDLANTIIGKSIPVLILDTKYKYGSSSIVKITME